MKIAIDTHCIYWSAQNLVERFVRNASLSHSICKMCSVLGAFANILCEIIFEQSLSN